MVKIIVDAMGGDNAPAATVQGAVGALKKDKDLSVVFTGRREAVEAELSKFSYDASRVEIIDCPDVVDMNDIPTAAVKKRNSSMMKAFTELKSREDLCGMVTAGSTGAAIVGGQLLLGKIKGIKRPALCCTIPNVNGGSTVLCDCGANAECKPVMLCQFAVLASAYSSAVFGIKSPKVGLLNNGTEEHKGDPLHQETYRYMSQIDCINFVGNVEGRDIMMGDMNVVVADGFTGNIALKSIEGCAKMMLNTMKKQFKSSPASMFGSLFLLGAVGRMKADLDFEKVGGALLLGLKKPVIKGHGSSKPSMVEKAVLVAAETHRANLIGTVEGMLEKTDLANLVPNEEE